MLLIDTANPNPELLLHLLWPRVLAVQRLMYIGMAYIVVSYSENVVIRCRKSSLDSNAHTTAVLTILP